ncbi:MAG: chorismate mutase [Verrucomicrobiae bacterium]|nr:chorismate mutase [Verrucomicrobiae bacterium]
METILSLRKRIDRLDDRIVALLARRFELARRIGHVKAALGGRVRDAQRERQILARLKALPAARACRTEVEKIYRTLLVASRHQQARNPRRRQEAR